MPRFHHAVKPGHLNVLRCDSFPTMVLTNRFKRLGSRPLSRSSRHPCLQTQYRPDRIRLSRRNFHGIIKETNVRWEGMLWNARSCTVTVTRFMSRWRRCSTPRWPKGRARSAAIRKAGAASSLQKMRKRKRSVYKRPRPSGRPGVSVQTYAWSRRTGRSMSNIHAGATSCTYSIPIWLTRSVLMNPFWM